jgi:hypothetical protein
LRDELGRGLVPAAENPDWEARIAGKPRAEGHMRDTATLTLPDQHRIAHAFLALTDDAELEVVKRSLSKAVAAFAAVLVLALAAPLTWLGWAGPVSVTPSKAGDQPAATLGNSKAELAAADDEDADGGG